MTDVQLLWVAEQYPQLAEWRELAVAWIDTEKEGIGHKLNALSAFLERYIIAHNLPLDPIVFLARNTTLPDFHKTSCPASRLGVSYVNHINTFLEYVLLHRCSELDDHDRPVILPAFYNPVPRLSSSGMPVRDEAKPSPLPYGYIDELRQMLAQGPHFSDWTWAHTALGRPIGSRGRVVFDWFRVSEEQIDRDDPDCVWRRRQIIGDEILEMWSPARWVALLVKLILPLRTFQVRMLDSGEADTWRYQGGTWVRNPNPLAQRSVRNPLHQGVFRRCNGVADQTDFNVLYINTNKTADIGTSGPEKGYEMPWYQGGELHQNAFYWLEKLRNWQEKYNPISRRTSWGELDGRHLTAKTAVQLAGYPDTCFLFRDPAIKWEERHYPVTKSILPRAWYLLLEALEQRMAQCGRTHSNGQPIRFLPPPEQRNKGQTTLFPLHSLRVSLITALALEGQVPFPILQKLVGHSRVLMTLYYFKPGATHISEVIAGAYERMEEQKGVSIERFLADTDYDELLRAAISNDVATLADAIPVHPAERNPVGWMPMHHGLCLVGGNVSEGYEDEGIGGCYNGGPRIGSSKDRRNRFAPVPGGARNCIRCRWFVTEPHHLPALVAHFNNLAYRFAEAREVCLKNDSEYTQLKHQRSDAESAGQPFLLANELLQAGRLWETSMARFNELGEDIYACWRLIERCKAALSGQWGDGTKLLAVGDAADVQVVLDEVDSELLQLAGVCSDVEIYPDLPPGKAIVRRSQLLDAVLYREGLPPLFMTLDEDEQLLAGNAFMDRLARQANPDNPLLGRRAVIELMDAHVSLSEYFGIDLATWLPKSENARALRTNQKPELEGPE